VRTDKKRPNARRKIMDLQKHPDPYVTTSDLAGYWRVSRKQIYKQIDAGSLRAIRLGPRLLRISTAEAIRFEDLAKMLPLSGGRIASHGTNGSNGERVDDAATVSDDSSRTSTVDATPDTEEQKRRRGDPE
jgi:excisionase family DNA binding protein